MVSKWNGWEILLTFVALLALAFLVDIASWWASFSLAKAVFR